MLTPLKEDKTIEYKRFDCATMTLAKAETVTPKKLVIIEGAYSMRPEFREFYDLSVFLDIPKDLQRERVLKRNPDRAQRFFSEWIPLEEIYFEKMQIKEKCDIVVEIK